jgi:hypothetical protein
MTGQDASKQGKQVPNWQSNVDSHDVFYQKMRFKKSVPLTTGIAGDPGLAYQASGSSTVLSVDA